MGDREKVSLRLQFNPQIRLELHGATITSDAGLLAFRELDDALDLTPIASDYLQESRTGRNIRHHLVPLLRQSIYSRLAGYDDTNDAERLSQDPAMRVVVGWQELLEPVVKGYQKKGLRLLFRGDAAFAKPELYEYLEQGKIGYAIRLPANQVIQEQIQPLLERPTEWPSREPSVSYHDFAYQAQSWHLPRRVVAKVEWHQGELFPRVGFIVTNLSYPPKGIVRFYNGRGTAEQWIKEGKYALNWTRLSCHKFVANQVRLWLFVLTYNLGNFMRRLVLPEDMKHWTLTSLQTRLIKTGGRLVRHARRLVFQLAEVLVTREMLTGILERISRLRLAPG